MNGDQHNAKIAVEIADARVRQLTAELAEAKLIETKARLRLRRAIDADRGVIGMESDEYPTTIFRWGCGLCRRWGVMVQRNSGGRYWQCVDTAACNRARYRQT